MIKPFRHLLVNNLMVKLFPKYRFAKAANRSNMIPLNFVPAVYNLSPAINKPRFIWAASWQNQQNGMCAQRRLRSAWADSIRPVWSVFAVRMKKAWVLSYLLSAQWRLWSDWVDAQVDLSLRWAHMPFLWFCHEAAHLANKRLVLKWSAKLKRIKTCKMPFCAALILLN